MCAYIATDSSFTYAEWVHHSQQYGIKQTTPSLRSVPPLINEKEELAYSDMEKAKVLNELFAFIFITSQASHPPCAPELPSGGERRKISHSVRVEQVQNFVRLNVYKSMGPAIRISGFWRNWLMWLLGEVSGDWKKRNITAVFKKSKKKRKTQGTTGLWAPCLCLGRSWNRSAWNWC